jgi:uncharacterized Ntn-hydrolase superfamily protein
MADRSPSGCSEPSSPPKRPAEIGAANRPRRSQGGRTRPRDGGCDVAVDLRVDDSPEPLTELARLYDLHQLYFGSTPEKQWLTVDPELRVQLTTALAKLGYSTGEFKNDLDAWAGTENFEERIRDTDRLDPVIIEQIQRQAGL